MSSRKRRGGAVDSGAAGKRNRLLPSSAGGTSQTEPVDLEERRTPAFEPAGGELTELTAESSEPEVIISSDDESAVDREQSQQQSQQQPHLFSASENSAGPQARNDEEEPRENDGMQPESPASPPLREGDSSEVQDREQSQWYPLGSRQAEISAELRSRDNEEESRDNDRARTASVFSPGVSVDDNAERQQYPRGSGAAEDADDVLLSDSEEESEDVELLSASLLCVIYMRRYLHLFEVLEQQRDRIRNRRRRLDGSGSGTGAQDAPVAASAPAEERPAEQGAARSDSVPSSAQQGVVISCPVCMDSYSEIVQSGRHLMSTMCGHVFCSVCLLIALETVGSCPTCRAELTPDRCHLLYI